jgi:hypothetical protein
LPKLAVQKFVIIVAPTVGRRGLASRELTSEERMHMPFPLAAVLPVESERWSCLSCRLQLLVLLHNDLLTGCGCASALISILKKTLAVKSTRLVCSL